MTKLFFTIENGNHCGLDLFTVKSKALNQRADISVYKPENAPKDLPVVVLLHGVYGSHWAWSLKANVHLTLEKNINEGLLPPMLLVMPSDGLFQDGSAYLAHQNANYEKWIAEEVPLLIKEHYKEVSNKSPFFIAGLSMGGYGALRIGAKYPKTFSAFSGLSSITQFSDFKEFLEDYNALKSSVIKAEEVFEVLLENQSEMGPFRFDCGSEDNLYSGNVKLHEQLQSAGIKHQFFTYKGEHNWEYWTEQISETLQFFANSIQR